MRRVVPGTHTSERASAHGGGTATVDARIRPVPRAPSCAWPIAGDVHYSCGIGRSRLLGMARRFRGRLDPCLSLASQRPGYMRAWREAIVRVEGATDGMEWNLTITRGEGA